MQVYVPAEYTLGGGRLREGTNMTVEVPVLHGPMLAPSPSALASINVKLDGRKMVSRPEFWNAWAPI